MNPIPRSEQLALLLNLLGEEATSAALASMDGESSQPVKAALEDFKVQPPTQEEVEFVLDDFEKYFRFAMETIGEDEQHDDSESQHETPILQIAEERFDVSLEPIKKFTAPELTGNIVHDLNRMHPYQVAYAIRDDYPITIAAVVRIAQPLQPLTRLATPLQCICRRSEQRFGIRATDVCPQMLVLVQYFHSLRVVFAPPLVGVPQFG